MSRSVTTSGSPYAKRRKMKPIIQRGASRGPNASAIGVGRSWSTLTYGTGVKPVGLISASFAIRSARVSAYRRASPPPIDCPDERKFEVVAAIAKHFAETHQVITIDGARILFEHGWGLVRASNTQAILVLRFEADTEEHLNQIRSIVELKVQEEIVRV